MPTIAEQITQLTSDRDDLVDNLTTKGITGLTGDETFTELVPEVLNIPSGGGDLNIFVQTTEPETKKGIWLQAEREIEHITVDENVYIEDTFSEVYNCKHYSGGSIMAYYNGYAYEFAYQSLYIFRNLNFTDTPETIRLTGKYAGKSCTFIFDNKVYCTGYDTKIYIYDLITSTETFITLPRTVNSSHISIYHNGYVYFIGGYNKSNCWRYNLSTGVDEDITSTPQSTYYIAGKVVVGNNIYIINSGVSTGSENKVKCYRYDTTTNTWYQIASTIKNHSSDGAVYNFGNKIYVFGGSTNPTAIEVYNINTDSWTLLQTTTPFNIGSSVGSIYHNGFIYFHDTTNGSWATFSLSTKTYSTDNTVVITQGKYSSGFYEIELIDSPIITNSLLFAFIDAWFYTTTNGIETNIPTYYGNGTNWIKIKN